MIDALCDIGKLILENEYKNDYSKDEINQKIQIFLENDKIKNYNNIIYIDFLKSAEKFVLDTINFEPFDSKDSDRLLYRTNGSGINLSPTVYLNNKNIRKNFDNKFVKWFEKNDIGKLSALSYEIIEKKEDIWKDIIKTLNDSDLINKNGNINNKTKILLSIRVKEKKYNDYKYLNDFDIFKKIFLDKAIEKYYKNSYGVSKSNEKEICLLCNEKKKLYGFVPSYIGLTFATADKKGSIPDFNIKNQWKQVGICEDCAFYLTIGKKFIDNKMNIKNEFKLNYYVIPKFFYNPLKNFRKIYDSIENNDKKDIETQLYEENQIKEIAEDLDDVLEFIYLYYEKKNKAVKILGYVESLLPSWLNRLYQKQSDILDEDIYSFFSEEKMKVIFSSKAEGNLIKYLKQKDKTVSNISETNWFKCILRFFMPYDSMNNYYIDTITSILKGKKINFDFLLSVFMNIIRTNWKKHEDFYIKTNTMKSLIIIVLLNDLDLFKGEPIMNKNTDTILNKLNTEPKKASFLLGVLTKKLCNIQYIRLESTPFFNKLGGLSLDYKEIKKLYPKIINKLREYNVYKAYDELEKDVSKLLCESENIWNLNRDETSYFFTLGYVLGDLYYNKEEKEEEGGNTDE